MGRDPKPRFMQTRCHDVLPLLPSAALFFLLFFGGGEGVPFKLSQPKEKRSFFPKATGDLFFFGSVSEAFGCFGAG